MITNVAPMAFQLEQDRCTCFKVMQLEGFPGGTVVKNLPANAGDARDTGLIPESGRSPGGGNGNAFQYSCLGNPIGRGAWQATVHRVTESRTWLKQLSTHT